MNIANKAYIITGGASGLGLATAQMIIENGGKVSLLDINEEAGKTAVTELGAGSCFIPMDITKEEDVKMAIKETLGHFAKIDGLINCAGVGPAKRVVGREGPHPLAYFEKVVQINLGGTFNMIRLVVNEMQHNETDQGERGIIINTASVAAFDGQIGQAAYAASKGGVVAMTLPIAREFARMGVRVMCIAPGIFETPLLATLPDNAKASLESQIPFPSRLGKASEYADLVKHIIENQMLNGEVIRLDGAIRMAAK